MNTGTIIVVALVATAILTAAGFMALRLAHDLGAFRKWRRVGPWDVSGPVDDKLLGEAMQAAERALFPDAEPSDCEDLLAQYRILVWDTPTIVHHGQTVAGLTSGPWDISVGSDLAALAHELAHALDAQRTGYLDARHDEAWWARWGKAIHDYEVWWWARRRAS